MTADVPKGRLSRAFTTGKVAAKIGTKQVGYLVKRRFMSEARQQNYKKQVDEDNARILFQGVSLLRGTALKAAQILSFERELLPESFQRELEKSYSQVPPMNRALVRQIIIKSLGSPPEALFSHFQGLAFAGASLGQVHRATSLSGRELAVKIQYPDMKTTIANDLSMVKTLVRPMPEYDILKSAIEEIRDVLLLETDYKREVENLSFFRSHLELNDVVTPEPVPELCSDQVLTMTFLPGTILSEWLKGGPPQESRNRVAQRLNDIFIRGFYELSLIHADPNPGNFMVLPDGRIGLLDFGCVRRISPKFVSEYRELIHLGGSRDKAAYLDLFSRMGFLSRDMNPKDCDRAVGLFMKMGAWINRLFNQPFFDFKQHPDFMAEGMALGKEAGEVRRLIRGVPQEIIFLDRTRYGLIRLFEQMGAKIRMRNAYETNDNI